MNEKIKNFEYRYWNEVSFYAKYLGIFCLFACIISLCILYFTNAFYYPDNEYKNLENEARRIIKTRSFETDYEMVITYYNSKDKEIDFELKDSKNTVYAYVDDYTTPNQKIYIIRGNLNNTKRMYFLLYIPLRILRDAFLIGFSISILLGFILKLIVKYLE